jgi:hypothetical protein
MGYPQARRGAVPACLAVTLSDDPKTPLAGKLAELEALAQTPHNEAALEPLRRLVHQPEKNETLRNEAGKVLLVWNPDWYVPDLIAMMQDPRHSDVWRTYCVQHLWEHYSRYKDQPSLDGLDLAARSQDYVIRSQAIFSLANIARDHQWHLNRPDRLGALSAELRSILSEAAKLPSPVQPASLHGDPVKTSPKPGVREASPRRLRAEDLDGVFSAIQILALKDLAPEAEAFAADEKQELSVRVAAVRALITIGRPESIPVLEKCAQSEDSRTLLQVAQLAMEALHRREGRGN